MINGVYIYIYIYIHTVIAAIIFTTALSILGKHFNIIFVS